MEIVINTLMGVFLLEKGKIQPICSTSFGKEISNERCKIRQPSFFQ